MEKAVLDFSISCLKSVQLISFFYQLETHVVIELHLLNNYTFLFPFYSSQITSWKSNTNTDSF